ncbi:hypothetical protein MBAV_004744, partial [Candidatus Magnetobacterium bavaricum]
ICDKPKGQTTVFSNTSIMDLKKFLKEMIKILEYKFPRIDGKVLNSRLDDKGNSIIKVDIDDITWKSSSGTRLFLFKKTFIDCDQRNFFSNETCQGSSKAFRDIYGKAVVTEPENGNSNAKVIEKNPNKNISIDDRVITK